MNLLVPEDLDRRLEKLASEEHTSKSALKLRGGAPRHRVEACVEVEACVRDAVLGSLIGFADCPLAEAELSVGGDE